ncbi:MAG: hypothetical protein JWP50_1717 [Phenylobacterium sp.]|nr:hypothetical protein [Phenylobacterium sp.]
MAKSKTQDDALLEELTAIKKLLVFALMRSGVSQKQIGTTLGVAQSSISRMFPGVSARPSKDVG